MSTYRPIVIMKISITHAAGWISS